MIQGIQAAGAQAASFQGVQAASLQGVAPATCDGVQSAGFQASSFESIQGANSQDIFRAALVGLLLGKSEDDKKNDPLLALAMLGMMQPMQMNFSTSSSSVAMTYQSAGVAPMAGGSFSATG
jgi:hypothetical protein